MTPPTPGLWRDYAQNLADQLGKVRLQTGMLGEPTDQEVSWSYPVEMGPYLGCSRTLTALSLVTAETRPDTLPNQVAAHFDSLGMMPTDRSMDAALTDAGTLLDTYQEALTVLLAALDRKILSSDEQKSALATVRRTASAMHAALAIHYGLFRARARRDWTQYLDTITQTCPTCEPGSTELCDQCANAEWLLLDAGTDNEVESRA